MTTAMPRKRKHAASASITTLDDGTNVVTLPPFKPSNNREVTDQRARRVRQRVNTAASEEAPVAHTNGSADTSQPRPGLPHQSSSDESVRIIPPECCYHCLTRGGNAAYQCARAGGEERCSRCVRDKRTTCRLPTSEQAVQIAARCPRCTMRGFKNCDGGTPCDTCIRNKTPTSCRSTSRKATRKNPASSEPSMATESANKTGTAKRQTSTSRKSRQESLITSQTTKSKKTAASNSPTPPKNIRRSGRLDAKEPTEKSRVHGEDYTPSPHRDTLLESDIQDLILREEDAGCSSADVSSTLLTAPETLMEVAQPSPPKPAARRLKERQLNLSYRPATRHTVGVSPSATQDFVRPSNRVAFTEPSTESTSPAQQTSSNAHINLTGTGDKFDLNVSQSTIRPRRSRSRVSYAEVFDDIDLDMDRSNEDDSGTDIFTAPTTDEEIDEYDETENTSEDDGDEHHMSVDGDEFPIEDLLTEDDEAMERLTESARQNKTRTTSQQKAGKGIDLSLPPLNNIQDCFTDLAAKGVLLGLGEALDNLRTTQIRLATMCSGTESPLLALQEISKALVEAKHPGIHFQHEFSAEIEPVKQGYIERNFQPKILFRDVRDFICESATTATTAYGAEVEIPTNIHILVAGFVCKDLSRLNNKNKGLEDGGESGDTWLAIYTYAKRFRPNIVLLENVKSTKEMWHDVVRRWDSIGYEATWLILDTKNYYLPQTRERMYMIAIERGKLSLSVKDAADKWRHIMEKLRRQCSSPYEAFIADSLQEPNTYSTPLSEPDWALCKLRYDHIRSKQKLGILSPVTQSSGSGTVRPPDFASREYFESQSSRVWDAIDVAHLQSAREGSDSLYKMAVWDVSQNVDRFKADRGILPCITPGGSDFASNRQQALSGSQLLLLQGMPLNRLIFANETQRDRQDLAGNAMSTTVIGASLIAAITSCWSSFLSPNPPIPDTLDVKNFQKARANWLVDANNLHQSLLTTHEYEGLDLAALRAAATTSARFCPCEGAKSISSSPVQICSACGHTACAACAGNPKHDYHEVIPTSSRSLSPDMFIRSWRPILPPRLKLDTFPDLSKLSASRLENDSLSEYLHTVREAQLDAQSFCIGDFARQVHHWTVKYSSPNSTLELQVGRKVKWLLYLNCPPKLPGNSSLRQFLTLPIACGSVNSSLLCPDWKIHMPSGINHQLQFKGSFERSRSWRSRLGLPDFRTETVPSMLTIKSNDQDLEAVTGEFEYLPHCGTASSSLYKRSTQPALYMFLDPNPIGPSEADCIVFSHDCSRRHYGESRNEIARLEPSWRSWNMTADCTSSVTATVPGTWITADVQLSPAFGSIDARHLIKSNNNSPIMKDCSQVLLCLDVHVHERLSAHAFHAYSWALEQPKTLPSFPEWQELHLNLMEDLTQDCFCAPPYPELYWSIDKKGIAIAQEDRKSAAIFERAVKSRTSAIQIKVDCKSNSTRIQVGLNVSSLLHRARASLGCSESTSNAWRLLTDHADLPVQPFAKFHLQSNIKDPVPAASVVPPYLRGSQAKSLVWMTKQELGRQITVTEVEEAVHAGLNWRLEARAQTTRTIRGGVLADHPSFGKTVTTIALIQNEFKHHDPETIIQQNQSRLTGGPLGLWDTAATLIVCPPHIAFQWQTELAKFLDTEEYECYNVLLIQNFSHLRSLTMEQVAKSRTIIVSWTVFAEDEYISELARFAAMPEPALTSRRAFDTWLARASEVIPDRLAVLQEQGFDDFRKSTADLLQERLLQPAFQATLPLKIRHGSAYESYICTEPSSKARKPVVKSKTTLAGKAAPKSWKKVIPLLHLYCFNRIIVDEYHYLNDDKNVKNSIAAISIKKIAAHKRWVLSGTPAMANFSDINQIASFIGLRLGRTFLGDGIVMTQSEKVVKADQTPVEDFLSRTEIKSRQWHQARHNRAQGFLDLFVRQNEAQLEHISCSEKLLPVQLDAAHHAVYLELSQHLVAQRMLLKKLSKKLNSDRSERLNESLNNSGSAEVALMKSALLFETLDGQSGLETLLTKRSQQRCDAEVELAEILCGFEGLMPQENIVLRSLRLTNPTAYRAKLEESVVTLYGHFKKDIKLSNWLGDSDASKSLTRLLARAEKSPNACAFPGLKGLSAEKRQRYLKQQLSRVREVSRELALRIRSERFIHTVGNALECSAGKQLRDAKCSAPQCTGSDTLSHMYVITQCGHTACTKCLAGRVDDELCVHQGCNSPLHNMSLIRMSDLGSIESNSNSRSFGNKLQAIVDLILSLPDDDQGIVFAPDEDIVNILEEVFDYFEISYHSPTHCKAAQSAKIIEDFKNNNTKKLLILNLGSESAAGVNLTNANHIIFVSPLPAKTQYEYDSAMVQAIARSRRYGQIKKVHIYHMIAERTIDVDILEHRHKRNDGISTPTSTMKLPKPSGTAKEQTRMIKNKTGETALVPRSWLDDVTKRKMLGVGKSPESLTSLIKFEGAFKHGDE